jgi:hypothetical protein
MLTTDLPGQNLTVLINGPTVTIEGVQSSANVTMANIVADKVYSSTCEIMLPFCCIFCLAIEAGFPSWHEEPAPPEERAGAMPCVTFYRR